MHTYSCMLCKKCNDTDFINICYQNGRNSVKDDILEFCGDEIHIYLDNTDIVCTVCLKVLENVAKLKRQVFEIIVDHATSKEVFGRTGKKTLKLSKVWNLSATPTSNYEDSVEAASPNNLLVPTSSIPFEERSDSDLEDARNKYLYGTPYLDGEVQRANDRRKRKSRGHNWSKRKGSRSSRNRMLSTDTSTSRSRSRSAVSRASRTTTSSRKQQQQKQAEELHIKRILGDLLCQNDALSQFTRVYLSKYVESFQDEFDYEFRDINETSSNNQVIKTRFARELREKLLSEYQKLIYECPHLPCTETSWSLESITDHIVKEHNETARFTCIECRFDYLTQEHLDKHRQKHFENFFCYCIFCFDEYRNKQLYEKHLDEHLVHSFPCIYCDRYYLNKQLCDNHIRELHPGRKRKIKRVKPQSILDRIDKYPDHNSKLNEVNCTRSNSNTEEFIVKVLLQNKDSSSDSTEKVIENTESTSQLPTETPQEVEPLENNPSESIMVEHSMDSNKDMELTRNLSCSTELDNSSVVFSNSESNTSVVL